MRTWRWQDLAVGGAGLAVLASSLTPWYVSGWAGPGPEDYHTSTANAWQSSTWWSVGVLIALLATGWRLLTHRLPWLPPLGALLGLGVVVWIWSRIGPIPPTRGWAVSGPDSGYGVVRDELFRLHEPGRDLGDSGPHSGPGGTLRTCGDPLAAHTGAVTALACVAVGGMPTAVSGGADRTVRFWNLAASPPVEAYRLYAPGQVDALAAGVHSGRPVVVVGTRSARMVCYDLADGLPMPGPPRPDRGLVHALATGQVAGRRVVVAGGGTAAFDAPTTGAGPDPPFARGGVADVLDLATGAVVASVAGHEREVGAVALGRSGSSTVLATAGSGTIRLWDAATGAATAGPLTDIPDAGTRQRWHARLLVFGGDVGHQVLMADGTTRLVRADENTGEWTRTDAIAFGFWGGNDGRPLGATTVVGPRTDVSALAAGEINGDIAYGMGHRNGTVVVFFDGGVPAGQPPLELPPVAEYELREAVTAIAFRVADERALLAVARCGRVDLADCTTGEPAGQLVGHRGDIRAVAFGRARDRSVIVTGGVNHTVRLWDPAVQRAAADGTVRPAQIRSIHVGARVNALACTGGGSRVVVGTDSGVVAITLDG